MIEERRGVGDEKLGELKRQRERERERESSSMKGAGGFRT